MKEIKVKKGLTTVAPYEKNLTTVTQDKIINYYKQKDGIFICISGATFNATGGSQRPQQLAEGFVEDFGVIHTAHTNGYSLQNFNGHKIMTANIKGIVNFLQNTEGVSKKVFYTAFPEKNSTAFVSGLGDDWFVIYDCVDEWEDFKSATWYKPENEQKIAKRADLVICTAKILQDKFKWHKNCNYLPNSTKVDVTGKDWSRKQPIDLVFVGFLNEEWIDFGLFRLLSKKFSIRIIGEPPNDMRYFEHKNVEWTGKKHSSEIVKLLSEAKVGIIPFKNQPLVHAVNPIKLWDYCAAGIPTVGAYMPEIETLPYGGFNVNSSQQFFKICQYLVQNYEQIDRKRLLDIAKENTYIQRVEQLRKWMSELS